MPAFAESTVEEATLFFLEALGYQVRFGPDLAPDAERRWGHDAVGGRHLG